MKMCGTGKGSLIKMCGWGLLAWALTLNLLTFFPTLSTHAQTLTSRPPMTEWFYADGIVNPEGLDPKSSRPGIWYKTGNYIILFNLSPTETTVTATFYFEDLAPRQHKEKVPARASGYIQVHDLSKVIPPAKLYGVRIQSEVPVIVQTTRGEFEPYNPVVTAMASLMAYPGPIGRKETKWAYSDGLTISSEAPMEQMEWITVLNPNAGQDVQVKVTFNFVGDQKSHLLVVPAERVSTVDLFHLPIFPKNKLAGVIIESNVPVIVQQVRRSYPKNVPTVTSMFTTMAYPIGDQKDE